MSETTDGSTEQRIRFSARDGYDLGGELFIADKPVGGIFITPGTGFPLRFYRRFAREAVKRGYTVLLYDCRGIDASAPEDLSKMDMHYTDWGRYDMPSALDQLIEAAPNVPLFHVGHSIGGHFVGLMDNWSKITAHGLVCSGAGYWGHHALYYRPLVMWFWHVYGNFSLLTKGYLAKGGGWTGESLPKGVFLQWKKWCHNPRFMADSLEQELKPHHYEEVTTPIRSFVYKDDPIARPKPCRMILNMYPKAPSELVIKTPKQLGVKTIGHAGPFAAQNIAASSPVLDWFDSHL